MLLDQNMNVTSTSQFEVLSLDWPIEMKNNILFLIRSNEKGSEQVLVLVDSINLKLIAKIKYDKV